MPRQYIPAAGGRAKELQILTIAYMPIHRIQFCYIEYTKLQQEGPGQGLQQGLQRIQNRNINDTGGRYSSIRWCTAAKTVAPPPGQSRLYSRLYFTSATVPAGAAQVFGINR
jgi:hypothetical protein